MFQGSIPNGVRSILLETQRGWTNRNELWVGCSGNLTIERMINAEGTVVHGCDVSIYTCALGWWLSGQPVPHTVKPDSLALGLDWLLPYLDGGVGTVATLMLGTRFLDAAGRDLPYYRRVMDSTQRQFPRMHAETVARLQQVPTRLASYFAGDVMDYVRDVLPADAPFASFPPFWAKGYERMFKPLDDHFDWPQPSFNEMGEPEKDELIARVVDRPEWLLGLHVKRPELRRHLVGFVKTTPRSMPIYVYAAGGATRIVPPNQRVEPLLVPKVSPDEELGGQLSLVPLTTGQFAGFRSQWMARRIDPGMPAYAFGVAVDGKLIGAFGCLPPKWDPNCVYLMSDFAVGWSKYRRLSKLVVMAAMSREAQQLLQRAFNRRLFAFATTAFSDNPVSSKYGRGIPGVRLTKRSEATDPRWTWQLQYEGPLGQWTLAEALTEWKRRHATHQKEPAAL